MRHYDVLFDRERQKIHFTRSNCSEDYTRLYFEDKSNSDSQNNGKKQIN